MLSFDIINIYIITLKSIEETAEDTTNIEEDIPAATIDIKILPIFKHYNIP